MTLPFKAYNFFWKLIIFLLASLNNSLFAQGLPGQDTSDNPRIVAWVIDKPGSSSIGTDLKQNDSVHFYYPTTNTKLFSSYQHHGFDPNPYSFEISSFIYDTWGNITLAESQKLNRQMGTWNNIQQIYYTYNPARQQTNVLTKVWRTGSTAWEVYGQDIYTYDPSNNLTKFEATLWNNGIFANSKKRIYTNNNQGKSIVALAQDWRNGGWVNVEQDEMTYDGTGKNLIETVWNFWDSSKAAFIPSLRFQYIYNSGFQLIQTLSDGWDTATHSWRIGYTGRNTYTYDIAGNLSQDLQQQIYPSTGSTYQNSYKYNYTYNTHNQPLTYNAFQAVNNTFTATPNWYRFRYYYNETPANTAINNLQSGGALLAVYPNPTGKELNISLKWAEAQAFTATITDMAGRLYTSFNSPATASYQQALSLSNLPSGNYLLSIRGNKGGGAVQKITVNH